jgi:hypothetical protein
MESSNGLAAYQQVHTNRYSNFQKMRSMGKEKLKIYTHPVLLVVSTIFFGVTIWYTNLSFVPSEEYLIPRLKSIHTLSNLGVLRFLQAATSASVGVVLHKSLSLLQWKMTGRPSGVRLITALSLAPSTSYPGLLGYLRNPVSTVFEKLVIFAKYA